MGTDRLNIDRSISVLRARSMRRRKQWHPNCVRVGREAIVRKLQAANSSVPHCVKLINSALWRSLVFDRKRSRRKARLVHYMKSVVKDAGRVSD